MPNVCIICDKRHTALRYLKNIHRTVSLCCTAIIATEKDLELCENEQHQEPVSRSPSPTAQHCSKEKPEATVLGTTATTITPSTPTPITQRHTQNMIILSKLDEHLRGNVARFNSITELPERMTFDAVIVANSVEMHEVTIKEICKLNAARSDSFSKLTTPVTKKMADKPQESPTFKGFTPIIFCEAPVALTQTTITECYDVCASHFSLFLSCSYCTRLSTEKVTRHLLYIIGLCFHFPLSLHSFYHINSSPAITFTVLRCTKH